MPGFRTIMEKVRADADERAARRAALRREALKRAAMEKEMSDQVQEDP